MRTLQHFVLVFICVSAVVKNSLQRSSEESSYYTAAVVEYSPNTTGTDLEVFNKNVDIYVEKIMDASNSPNNADIIVFPECGLVTLNKRVYTQIPSPSSEPAIVPCDDDTDTYSNLRNISCAAKEYSIYVVINLYEIYPCTNATTSDYDEPCPTTGAFYYNTNVVFDRDGGVVARYRKFNLFGETGIGTPPKPDLITFTTDFGVTFGLFTCFDIMFEKPAIQLVRESNITDFIFPTAWFSELPFLTAVQTQAAWAYSMDVNLLAAGYDDPSLGSGGSGIYEGRKGPLSVFMPSSPTTVLLVSSVSKIPRSVSEHLLADDVTDVTDAFGLYLKQDNLLPYKSHLLDLNVSSIQVVELCDGGFCCHFEVSGTRVGEGVWYSYRLVAFNGVRTFDGVANGGLQVCSLVACINEGIASCGLSFPATTQVGSTEFHQLRVRGDFKKDGTQFPNTVTQMLLPLNADDYEVQWTSAVEDLVTIEMTLAKNTSVITFGIYGRDFSRDHERVTPNRGATTILTAFSFINVLTLALRYF